MTIGPALLFTGLLMVTSRPATSQDTLSVLPDSSVTDASVPVFRGGVLTFFSRRNATLAGQVGRGTGVHPGAEISMWWPGFLVRATSSKSKSVLGVTDFGIYGRVHGGGFSSEPAQGTPGPEAAGQINNADLELYAGRRVLHARVGYGLRSFTGSLGTTRWSFVRLGARSSFSLGNSNEFEVTVGAAFYLGVNGGAGGSGREGETRLTFVPRCGNNPTTSWLCRRIFGILAYRFEQFTAHADAAAGGNRPEEIASVIIGLGIRTP